MREIHRFKCNLDTDVTTEGKHTDRTLARKITNKVKAGGNTDTTTDMKDTYTTT